MGSIRKYGGMLYAEVDGWTLSRWPYGTGSVGMVGPRQTATLDYEDLIVDICDDERGTGLTGVQARGRSIPISVLRVALQMLETSESQIAETTSVSATKES